MSGGLAGRTGLLDAIDAVTDRPDDPDQRRRTTQLIRKYFAALFGKDADAVRQLLSDDVLTELPFSESGRVDEGYFRSFRGIEEVMAFWTTTFTLEGDDSNLYDAEITVSGDGRVVFLEAFGHTTMSNGHDYRNRYVIRVTVDDDDKIATFREYYNPIVSARAFGRENASAQ